MRRGLVVGNWKMNGNRESIAALMQQLVAQVGSFEGADIAVCPSLLCHGDRAGLAHSHTVTPAGTAEDKGGGASGGTDLIDHKTGTFQRGIP